MFKILIHHLFGHLPQGFHCSTCCYCMSVIHGSLSWLEMENYNHSIQYRKTCIYYMCVCVTKSTFMLSSPCRLSIIIKYSKVIVKNCRSRLITFMVRIKRITIAHINLQRDHKWPRLVTWSVLNSIFSPLICLLGMGAGKVQFSWTTVRGGEVTSLGSFYG